MQCSCLAATLAHSNMPGNVLQTLLEVIRVLQRCIYISYMVSIRGSSGAHHWHLMSRAGICICYSRPAVLVLIQSTGPVYMHAHQCSIAWTQLLSNK